MPLRDRVRTGLLASGWDDVEWVTLPHDGPRIVQLVMAPSRCVLISLHRSTSVIRAAGRRGETPAEFTTRLFTDGYAVPLTDGRCCQYPASRVESVTSGIVPLSGF
jgi:hypothetical protein